MAQRKVSLNKHLVKWKNIKNIQFSEEIQL